MPPWSMEMSTMTEPFFMPFTISSVMMIGAILPGMRAEQKTMSISWMVAFRASCSLMRTSAGNRLA